MCRLYRAAVIVGGLGLCVGSAQATLITIDDFSIPTSLPYAYDSQPGLQYTDDTWQKVEAVANVLGGWRTIRVNRDNGQGSGVGITGKADGGYTTFIMNDPVTGVGELVYGRPNGGPIIDLSIDRAAISFFYQMDSIGRDIELTLTLTDINNSQAIYGPIHLPGERYWMPYGCAITDFPGVDESKVKMISLYFDACDDANSGGRWDIDLVQAQGAYVPEPASCVLLAVAVGGLGVLTQRRRKS